MQLNQNQIKSQIYSTSKRQIFVSNKPSGLESPSACSPHSLPRTIIRSEIKNLLSHPHHFLIVSTSIFIFILVGTSTTLLAINSTSATVSPRAAPPSAQSGKERIEGNRKCRSFSHQPKGITEHVRSWKCPELTSCE